MDSPVGNLGGFKKKKNGTNKKWVLLTTVSSFFSSAFLLFLSQTIFEGVGIFASILVLLFFIIIGIVFDIIGTAVAAAEETPFHAMAAKKQYGAKQSVKLIRNADRVANFSNDIVGDICGVISGTVSALMVAKIADAAGIKNTSLLSMVMSGLAAALTVGGKGIGKSFAINNSNYIIYKVSIFISFFKEKLNFLQRKDKE